MKSRRVNSIPTDAEFEAASKSMAARIRSEESIKSAVVRFCCDSNSFHDAYVWLPDGKCHVDLFVLTDADLDTTEAKALRDSIASMLVSSVDGDREITVELDSHERIKREFNGNYFNRFR